MPTKAELAVASLDVANIGALVRTPFQDHRARMAHVHKERDEKMRALKAQRAWHKAELEKLDKMLVEMLTW